MYVCFYACVFLFLFCHFLITSCPSSNIILDQYISSIYWGITVLLTVGFGDIVPINPNEKAFNILVYILGTIIYAIVVVHLHGIVAQLDVTSDIFKSRKDRVKAFMIRETFNEAMVKRVKTQHDRQWAVERGAEGHELRSFLPQSIYANVVYTAIQEILSRTFLFKNPSISHSFKMMFVSKLVLEIYNKDDFFFHTGEIPNKIS